MADASVPHAISNWHSFKVMLPSANVMRLTNSRCRCSFFRSLSSRCCQGRGAEERVRPHDKYIVLSCLFFSQPHFPTLFLVSFASLFYHCQSFTSLSLYYYCLPSFSLNLLPLCTTATSPSPSSALWHLFASWGLRGQLLLSDLSCFKCSHYNMVT